jgi:hypothetical protein
MMLLFLSNSISFNALGSLARPACAASRASAWAPLQRNCQAGRWVVMLRQGRPCWLVCCLQVMLCVRKIAVRQAVYNFALPVHPYEGQVPSTDLH